MLAKEIMTRSVVSANPGMTIQEAAALLVDHRIMGAPVVNAAGFLVGVISQTDIIRHEREAAGRTPRFYLEPETRERLIHVPVAGEAQVKDLMTPIVISASRDDDVLDVARMMIDQRIHRIIIAENGKLYGIISAMDVLKAFTERLESSREAAPSRPGRR